MKKYKFKGVNSILYYHKLKNGLEIYMLPNNNVKNFYITYNTKFGSLYTEFKKNTDDKYISIPNGVAHFLEHITFKMEDMDASDYFSSIGSNSNAYTSFKITGYEVLGHSKFKDNLSYLLKFVNTPCYSDKNVNDEKGIIIEEIKMNKDNPYNTLYFEMNKSLFHKDKRKNLVCGEVDDVKKTTKKDILNAYNYFYNPSNMFIIITGNFNQEEALSIIEEEMTKYKHESFDVTIKNDIEENTIVKEHKEIECNIETPKISLGFKLPLSKFGNLNITNLELMLYLSLIYNSNFGYSSILREDLINGNVINGGISIDKYFISKFLITTLTSETEYPNRVKSILKEKLDNLELSEDDFIRKKRVFISNYILGFDDIEFINESISDDIIEYSKLNNDIYDVINNLNYETALKVMKRIKVLEYATVIIKPKSK